MLLPASNHHDTITYVIDTEPYGWTPTLLTFAFGFFTGTTAFFIVLMYVIRKLCSAIPEPWKSMAATYLEKFPLHVRVVGRWFLNLSIVDDDLSTESVAPTEGRRMRGPSASTVFQNPAQLLVNELTHCPSGARIVRDSPGDIRDTAAFLNSLASGTSTEAEISDLLKKLLVPSTGDSDMPNFLSELRFDPSAEPRISGTQQTFVDAKHRTQTESTAETAAAADALIADELNELGSDVE
jgi:hypothetical protein